MNDPGDLVLVERALERLEVGDVAAHEVDPVGVGAEHELEPRAIVPEVEADDARAVVEGGTRDPGAEAAEDAGDEEALWHLTSSGRPGTPSRPR